MADVFLEVDEQLRSARLQALFRKTWPYVTGAIVAAGLVSLGVWGVEKYQTDAAAKSSLAYADAATALSSGDAKRPYHALAQEALAIERLAAGHSAEARADFQVLALSLDSSEATRARANAALALIKDHADASVAAIAKGAIGLTPMAPPAVPGGGQMIQAPAQAEPQTAEPQTGAAQ